MYVKSVIILSSMLLSSHSFSKEPMTHFELGNVVAQSSATTLIENIQAPLSELIDFDGEIGTISYYHESDETPTITDKGVLFNLPENIDFIKMNNIRVKNSLDGSSFGNIEFSNIRFSEGSSILIKTH